MKKTLICLAVSSALTGLQAQTFDNSVRGQSLPLNQANPERLRLDETLRDSSHSGIHGNNANNNTSNLSSNNAGNNALSNEAIHIKDVVITGARDNNAEVLKNFASSRLAGKDKTLQEIQAVAAEMTQLFFKSRGFDLSRVYIPVQTLDETNAVITLSVLEGKYGKINIVDSNQVNPYNRALVEKRLGIVPGQQLEARRLERGLLLADDLPGIKVESVEAVPGENPGESDYTIRVKTEDKLSFTTVADNQGNTSTGKNRLIARVAIANPTGNGDEIEAGIIHSGKGLTAGQVAYSLPFSIGQSQGWKASVSASKINYRLTDPAVKSLDAYGTSEGVSAALTYALVRSQDTNVGFSTQVNYQKLTDYLLGQQFNKKNSKSFSLGLSGDAQRIYSPALGASFMNWTLASTFGDLDIKDPTAKIIDSLSAKTQGSYMHLNSSASLTQSLDAVSNRLSAYVSASGQYANKNLDSSEKFVITGPAAVRGYSQGTVSADNGYIINTEIRYALPAYRDVNSSIYAFYDYGHGKIYRNSYSADIGSQSVSAAGIGASMRHKNGIFASLSLSKGSGYKNAIGAAPKDNTFAWLQVGYKY